MSSTKKKQKSTKKNTKLASKKRSPSSKTRSSLSKQTLTIVKTKKDLSLSDTQKKKDVSLSSSVKSKTNGEKSLGLSLHDVLSNVKKRSTKDQKAGKSGFVKLLKHDKDVLKKAKFENAMGRPPKKEEEKLQVESIRFSELEKDLLIEAAKKGGFISWKKYVKHVALENAKKSA